MPRRTVCDGSGRCGDIGCSVIPLPVFLPEERTVDFSLETGAAAAGFENIEFFPPRREQADRVRETGSVILLVEIALLILEQQVVVIAVIRHEEFTHLPRLARREAVDRIEILESAGIEEFLVSREEILGLGDFQAIAHVGVGAGLVNLRPGGA